MDERNYSLACILLSVTCMIFSGCAIFTYDQSTKPEMSVLVGHTFAIENDSFLITNRCIVRPDKGECLYIQEAGGNIVVSKNGYIKDARLPNSMPDYIKNKALYDADLSDSGFLLYRPRNVAGYVPAGTKIQITKLVSWPLGDTGRCWIVQGNLEMGAGIQPV